MAELEDLYQEVVRDHYSRPRNFGKPPESNRTSEGFNPFCGDIITLYLNVTDGRIDDVGFEGGGCAISKASASLMTESVMGKTPEEAAEMFQAVRNMLTQQEEDDPPDLGDLEVLAGVSAFPVRIKCATLCWHTLRAALDGQKEPVTTE